MSLRAMSTNYGNHLGCLSLNCIHHAPYPPTSTLKRTHHRSFCLLMAFVCSLSPSRCACFGVPLCRGWLCEGVHGRLPSTICSHPSPHSHSPPNNCRRQSSADHDQPKKRPDRRAQVPITITPPLPTHARGARERGTRHCARKEGWKEGR